MQNKLLPCTNRPITFINGAHQAGKVLRPTLLSLALLLFLPLSHAACIDDADWNQAARKLAQEHYPDLYQNNRVPKVVVCAAGDIDPSLNGKFETRGWRIAIKQGENPSKRAMLAHELGHAAVAFRHIDAGGLGGHGVGWMKVMIDAGFDGDARWFAQHRERQFPGIVQAYETAAGHPHQKPA